MSSSGIVAVVPMKPLNLSKTRLAGRLTLSQRMALSLEMFKNVVQVAVESEVAKVWVIGGDESIMQTAYDLGAEWCVDESKDLNGAISVAAGQAFKLNLAVMYLPADLPFVTSADINALADASNYGRILTLSPAHSDGGTNAALMPSSSPFRLTLGLNSFQRHLEQVKSLALETVICDLPGFGFDLDTPDDLDVYEGKLLDENSAIERVAD